MTPANFQHVLMKQDIKSMISTWLNNNNDYNNNNKKNDALKHNTYSSQIKLKQILHYASINYKMYKMPHLSASF